MTVKWGAKGNYAIKFLASQEGVDPHDDALEAKPCTLNPQ